MAAFEEIDGARKTLGLEESASRKEIKQAYRKLAFYHHPDRAGDDLGAAEAMKKLNKAYQLLMDYIGRFHYTFREEDVNRVYPEEAYLRRWRDCGP